MNRRQRRCLRQQSTAVVSASQPVSLSTTTTHQSDVNDNGVVVTNKLNIVRFSALKHIKLVTVLRPVYSDATQLNSTRRRVELRRYRHPHWVTTFRTDR